MQWLCSTENASPAGTYPPPPGGNHAFAVFKPLQQLPRLLDLLDSSRPIAVYSRRLSQPDLRCAGFRHVMNWELDRFSGPCSTPGAPLRQELEPASPAPSEYRERKVTVCGSA